MGDPQSPGYPTFSKAFGRSTPRRYAKHLNDHAASWRFTDWEQLLDASEVKSWSLDVTLW